MQVIALAAIVSCGYQPLLGTVPGGDSKVHVPLVENKTPYLGLAGSLTSAIRLRLAGSGIPVTSYSRNAATLAVTINRVEGKPGMLGTKEDKLIPVDSIWRIQATARLIDSGKVLIAGPFQFEVAGRAFSGDNVQAEESLGHHRRQSLLDDLADEIARHLFEK